MKLLRRWLVALVVTAFCAFPVSTFAAAPFASARFEAPASSSSPLASVLTVLAAAGVLGATIRIRDTGAIAKKFVNRAGLAGGDYADGVKTAGPEWEEKTKASEDNYKQSVTQAAADGRFGKGVAAAGQQKYVERASTLGAQRYPTGVQASEAAYSRGVQPHLDMMKSLDLPPRKPKGQNQDRANIVAAANRKLKLGR